MSPTPNYATCLDIRGKYTDVYLETPGNCLAARTVVDQQKYPIQELRSVAQPG
jgi:hypothetical protein